MRRRGRLGGLVFNVEQLLAKTRRRLATRFGHWSWRNTVVARVLKTNRVINAIVDSDGIAKVPFLALLVPEDLEGIRADAAAVADVIRGRTCLGAVRVERVQGARV